ncbi:ankyrin repeat domain-containing protein [Herbidospora sp. NEAU-GS84]|uniref:Ankyrin repeat domain-containing protein n=1 Tax=Herbidospora solisilvae TaxID=2696284 RepID=A0A7C9P1V8_9ACTN|nr:ankyrin repeat domain-containing protein [Herbidospora solisilvae]NAS25317.1 ankyrin repeat domain-containing protein [Herbidospora solisilvae]
MGESTWSDLGRVRAHLAAGADPNGSDHWGPVLFRAAAFGSPEVVAELADRVADVDAIDEGHTALWSAVFHRQPGNARALVGAGADPWRAMMNGWSPARLALAGPTPDLFPPGDLALSPGELAAVALSEDLFTALESIDDDGHSIACVAGVTAAEAARRLGGTVVTEDELGLVFDDPGDAWHDDRLERVVGVTDVTGGCVVTQPWGWHASDERLLRKLTRGTRGYAMFANPKSGEQGVGAVDGEITDWDTILGLAPPTAADSAEELLRKFLYQDDPEAYCCGYAGLHLTDARPILGPPDLWIRLDPTR